MEREALYICDESSLEEGYRKIVQHQKHEIALIHAGGVTRAYLNRCPHQGGPVCDGLIINRVEEVIDEQKQFKGFAFSDDLHLVCPWHGWEFNLETGQCAGDGKVKIRQFEVLNRDGKIYVQL